MEAIKWLITEYAPDNLTTDGTVYAAGNGKLEVVKWLYEGYPFTAMSIDEVASAAESGYVEVVKWLVEHQPPLEHRWDNMTDEQWERELHKIVLRADMFASASLEYLQ